MSTIAIVFVTSIAAVIGTALGFVIGRQDELFEIDEFRAFQDAMRRKQQ